MRLIFSFGIWYDLTSLVPADCQKTIDILRNLTRFKAVTDFGIQASCATYKGALAYASRAHDGNDDMRLIVSLLRLGVHLERIRMSFASYQ